jgi:hypothetical protein
MTHIPIPAEGSSNSNGASATIIKSSANYTSYPACTKQVPYVSYFGVVLLLLLLLLLLIG